MATKDNLFCAVECAKVTPTNLRRGPRGSVSRAGHSDTAEGFI